ncbi:hypothetical protein M433DRAFT_280634 [Acidomyces richmondensis BFW]|nr:MAG: hypothetical protein FE78DRAFT_437268 [Acidomyces sp. 'richmondensis']KYG44852.1 hypothetical protein M433DRAFT_280634 [Acidomyces richmondensis BFW]
MSRMLLVRGLSETVDEQEFANAVQILVRDAETTKGAAPGSVRCIYLIRNRKTDKHAGFGFIEFHTTHDAPAAAAKHQELCENQQPCVIGGQKITITYAHSGVFLPASIMNDRDNTHRFTILLPFTHESTSKYHDSRYYASQHMINEHPPAVPADNSSSKQGSGEKTSKKRKQAPSTNNLDPVFQRWQDKSEELRAGKGVELGTSSIDKVEAKSKRAKLSVAKPDIETFCIHTEKLTCCLLCNQWFPQASIEQLHKHLRGSQTHRDNLNNEQAKKKGYARLKAKGVASIPMIPATQKTSNGACSQTSAEAGMYRDRAAERRQEEEQTVGPKEKFAFALKGAGSKQMKPSPPGSDNEASSKPLYNKGLEMLKKQGYTGNSHKDGSGLIDQSLYAAGVGLGHETSRIGDAVQEAARTTKGGSGFIEKTKEVFRDRFEKMQ